MYLANKGMGMLLVAQMTECVFPMTGFESRTSRVGSDRSRYQLSHSHFRAVTYLNR